MGLFIFHLPVSQIIELLTKQIDDVILSPLEPSRAELFQR